MDRKLIWVGIWLIALIAVAVLVTVALARPPQYYATVYEPKAVPDFTRPTAAGGTFRLSDQKGRVVLLFFGFTRCVDVCPTTMANLRQAVSQLGPDTGQVAVVFITVDPARDTPQRVRDYVSQFDKSFIGLSGSAAELEQVWSEYGIYREPGPPDASGNYDVSHTARVTVLDKQGNSALQSPLTPPGGTTCMTSAFC